MKTSPHDFNEKIEFFCRKFAYNRNVLIPRLETESLVRYAKNIIKNEDFDYIIDLGTWSWIIGITLSLESGNKEVFLIDKSSRALKTAEFNSKKLLSSTITLKSDLFSVFFENKKILRSWSDLLIATNLPYIKDWDFENMSPDTIDEPKMALFWWAKTWFELYEKFFKQAKELKKNFNLNKIRIIAEFWFDQREVAWNTLDKLKIPHRFFSDLRNIERFVDAEI